MELCIDRIFQPCQRVAVNCHHVKPACGRHFEALQINVGGDDQPCLFGGRDAGRGAAVAGAGALSHLNEDQRALILHDQVDFPALAAKITLLQRQAVLLQMCQRIILTGLAANLLIGARPLECIK